MIAINKNLTCQLWTFTIESPCGPIRGHHEASQDDSDDEPVPNDPTLRPSTAPASPHVGIPSPVCQPRPDPVHHPALVPPPVGDPPPVPEDIVPLPPDHVSVCSQSPSALGHHHWLGKCILKKLSIICW